jgi:hypothetical protein
MDHCRICDPCAFACIYCLQVVEIKNVLLIYSQINMSLCEMSKSWSFHYGDSRRGGKGDEHSSCRPSPCICGDWCSGAGGGGKDQWSWCSGAGGGGKDFLWSWCSGAGDKASKVFCDISSLRIVVHPMSGLLSYHLSLTSLNSAESM